MASIFGIISSIGTYGYCQYDPGTYQYEICGEILPKQEFFRKYPEAKLTGEILTELISILVNGLLLYGLEKRKSRFFLPWLAMSMIGNIVSTLFKYF